MNKIQKILFGLVAVLGVALISASVARYFSGVKIIRDTFQGAAGDTYQSAKAYAKTFGGSATTTLVSIPCPLGSAGSIVKSVQLASLAAAGNSATTTITIGISSTTLGYDTSVTSGTLVTTTANYTYIATDISSGTATQCSSGKYLNAVTGVAASTTGGILNLDFINNP